MTNGHSPIQPRRPHARRWPESCPGVPTDAARRPPSLLALTPRAGTTTTLPKQNKRSAKCVWALLGSAAYTGDVLATTPTTPPALTTTILGQSRFDPIRIDARQFLPDWRARHKTRGLSDVYVVDNKFQPGATTRWHSHPGPSLILVTPEP